MTDSLPGVRWVQGEGLDAPKVGLGEPGVVVIEWPRFARVTVGSGGDDAQVEWLADVPPLQRLKFERGAIRTLPWYLRGALVLHAASVSYRGAGVVLLGATGSGKSTTAAALCKRGAELLSDDSTVVLNGVIQPVESRTHWLRPDSADALGCAPSDEVEEKHPIPARASSTPAPVRLVLSIKLGDSLHLQPQRGSAAIQELLQAALRLPLGAQQATRDFAAMSGLVEQATFYQLLRSPKFSVTLVDELVRTILDLLE